MGLKQENYAKTKPNISLEASSYTHEVNMETIQGNHKTYPQCGQELNRFHFHLKWGIPRSRNFSHKQQKQIPLLCIPHQFQFA